MHHYSRIQTAAGWFRVACSREGITRIASAKGSSKAFETLYCKLFGILPQPGDIPASYIQAVRDAAAGREPNRIPIDLGELSDFQKTVLNALRQVPRGEVRTYKELAALAGRPKAVRAVGNAMARNPVPLLIPCHRIVPCGGGVGNYGLGVRMKRELLSREGVPVDKL